jgi:hypothetical protein
MLIDRQLIAPEAPHVKLIADRFDLLPVLASAWVEMTLQEPHGAEAVHNRLEDCIAALTEGDDARASQDLRGVIGDFDRMCAVCAAHEAERTARDVAATEALGRPGRPGHLVVEVAPDDRHPAASKAPDAAPAAVDDDAVADTIPI